MDAIDGENILTVVEISTNDLRATVDALVMLAGLDGG